MTDTIILIFYSVCMPCKSHGQNNVHNRGTERTSVFLKLKKRTERNIGKD